MLVWLYFNVWWRSQTIFNKRKGKGIHPKVQDENKCNMGIRDRNYGHGKDTPQRCVHLPQFQMAEISIQTGIVCGCNLLG